MTMSTVYDLENMTRLYNDPWTLHDDHIGCSDHYCGLCCCNVVYGHGVCPCDHCNGGAHGDRHQT